MTTTRKGRRRRQRRKKRRARLAKFAGVMKLTIRQALLGYMIDLAAGATLSALVRRDFDLSNQNGTNAGES